jgi:hypothetical protein
MDRARDGRALEQWVGCMNLREDRHIGREYGGRRCERGRDRKFYGLTREFTGAGDGWV